MTDLQARPRRRTARPTGGAAVSGTGESNTAVSDTAAQCDLVLVFLGFLRFL